MKLDMLSGTAPTGLTLLDLQHNSKAKTLLLQITCKQKRYSELGILCSCVSADKKKQLKQIIKNTGGISLW